tara:strand:- start:13862 stop:14533 length:672 start_codon:yes stop_codon:yes gene_type:complete
MTLNSKHILVILIVFASQLGHTQQTKQLFNSKNLKGWYAFEANTGKHNNASEVFKVENNMIRLFGKDAGYLITKKSFKNFELTLDFRWNTDTLYTRKNNKKNSGVMYLVPKKTHDTLWPKGVQFQVKEDGTGDFILLQGVTLNVNGTKTEPGRSVVSKHFIDAENPIGAWNTIIITCKNGSIEQKLNGKLVNSGIESSVLNGRILLQYEGFPIDFRHIEVKHF